MQAQDGGSIYLGEEPGLGRAISTRQLEQSARERDASWEREVVEGGYWLRRPHGNTQVAVAYCGAVAPEAMEATHRLAERLPNVGLLAVTSPDLLHAGWTSARRARAKGDRAAASHVDRLLAPLPSGAGLVTVIDGHPASLSWLGSVSRHSTHALGVERFGQSADLSDLYDIHQLDSDAIVAAAQETINYGRGI